jgi:hypothetical protein
VLAVKALALCGFGPTGLGQGCQQTLNPKS